MRGVPRPSSGSNAGRPDVLAKLVANIWSKIDYTILPCKTVKESIKLEEATIASLKPKYNRAPGTGGFKGMHSIEGRKRISDHQKLRVVSDETKRKISLAAKGRKHSDSAKMKMSISRLGKPRPDIRLRMIGNKNLVGHHHSEETRRRISEANLGSQLVIYVD